MGDHREVGRLADPTPRHVVIPYVLQLAAIGLAWVSLHCVGMCGPIVAGIVTADAAPDDPDRGLWSAASRVLAYQAGRAVTYAVLGAAAGGFGAAVDAAVRGIGEVAALAVGAALLLVGTWRLLALGSPPTLNDGETFGPSLARAARRILRLVPARGRWRVALFGTVLGFLPCMLMFWVLGLAASTGDPLLGALLMVGLVAGTTPVLLAAGTSPLVSSGFLRRHSERIVGAALLLSGVWLCLIGAAANGWLEHAAWTFSIGERTFRMMLW